MTTHGVQLSEFRDKLLDLHKTLIDSERERYEKAIGPITSPNHFLQLLTTDPWFAWLHPLSLLIVSIDEVFEEKEPLTDAVAEALRERARAMLVATENAAGLLGNYLVALQQDPKVVMDHADVLKAMR